MYIAYYSDNIKKFIHSLEKGDIKKIYNALEILETLGSNIDMPLSKPIGDGLFELRVKNIRILYTFRENSAVLLSIFKKKLYRIPRREIDLAKYRLNSL
ncbi:MAG: type II toxin-antitoxin system RelE/ParE family toxin [bacterium]